MVEKSKGKGGIFGIIAALGVGILGGLALGKLFSNDDEKQKDKNNNKKDNYHNKIVDELALNKNFSSEKNYKEKITDTDIENLDDEKFMDMMFCPISLEIMKDPVVTHEGITYDRKSIEKWLEKNNYCPQTKNPLSKKNLVPNYALKQIIDEFIRNNKETDK